MIDKTIKRIVKKILLGNKCNSVTYINYLRKKGMLIGDNTDIYASPRDVTIDETRPWLISIGSNVSIAKGVTILTHGYDWSVLKGVYGDVLGSSGRVHIGNNVFIGMQSTILKGVHIGDNVIIGANSLINKDIPDNVVAAGNPCKVIMSLDEYHKKRKEAQIREARECVNLYRERYGEEPCEKTLHEFFWLFCDGNDILPECWNNMMKCGGNYEISKKMLAKNKKQFFNLIDFLGKI